MAKLFDASARHSDFFFIKYKFTWALSDTSSYFQPGPHCQNFELDEAVLLLLLEGKILQSRKMLLLPPIFQRGAAVLPDPQNTRSPFKSMAVRYHPNCMSPEME